MPDRSEKNKKKKKPTATAPIKVKDDRASRRIALVNLPKAPASKHGKLFSSVLKLILKYGDVVSYEEEIEFNEGDAGFYLPLDKRRERVFGCAFVEYEKASAAEEAVVALKGVKVGMNKIKVVTGDSKLLLVQCLGCSIVEAATYLDIVDGDISRAAEAIIRGDVLNIGDVGTAGYEEGNVKKAPPAAANKPALVATVSKQVPKESKPDRKIPPAPSRASKEIKPHVQVTDKALAVSDDDRYFYKQNGHLVDSFIDAICGGATKKDLRDMISEADALVTNQVFKTGISQSDLVNRPSFRHNKSEGRTPLSYAVSMNLKQSVHDLMDLGADVSKSMASRTTLETALTIAATNPKRDGTEMVRILLSKGADPEELVASGVDEKSLGLGMRYWLNKARRVGVPNKHDIAHLKNTPPMDRLHELDFAVVGEEAAVHEIQDALASRFGNSEGQSITGKPLVMLLLGPPGHGKTYFSSNAARSLVGEENFLFIPCQSIRDDADLFGSRLGGARVGSHSSDGQLTSWLRQREGKKCVVFLDEIEKMIGMTSSLGWGQSKKIFQSFLEPWQDGTLTDPGASSRGKINCKQCVWIATSNWGQDEIIAFYEDNKSRMQKKIDRDDAEWIQNYLVNKILSPLIIKEFGSIDKGLKALARRIDTIVPFLPFTLSERKVVADTALTQRLSLYREPCVLEGSEKNRRSFGNLRIHSTRAFAAHASSLYDPMQGAGALMSAVQRADGKFQMMYLRNQFVLTPEQKASITDPKPTNGSDLPEFWVHYDEDISDVRILQSKPPDDSECSDDSSESEDDDVEGSTEDEDHVGTFRRSAYSGAADDAF